MKFVTTNFRFLDMFFRESRGSSDAWPLLLMTIISASANAILLVIINQAAHTVDFGNPNYRLFILFVITIALFIISQKYVLSKITKISETIVNAIRVRLADKVRKSDFYELEKLGNAEVYSRISKDSTTITQTSPVIMNAIQSAVMVFFCMIYIFFLSPIAFWLSVLAIVGSIIYYLVNDKKISAFMRVASDQEVKLFDVLGHVLNGFKEIKVNTDKSNDVIDELSNTSDSVRDAKVNALIPFANNYIYSIVFFYLLIAIIIFLLPNLYQTFNDVVVKLTTAVLFMVGPLSNVVNMVSLLSQSNIAVENLYELEERLDNVNDGNSNSYLQWIEPFKKFKNIDLKNISFTYKDDEGDPLFSVEPSNLEIKRNEVIFIIGGNGSGKTTFLKLLTGLYHSSSGQMTVDDNIIQPQNIQAYRELFSVIFSDFHLFDKLYGLRDIEPFKVNDLLKLMEISDKTTYDDNRFSNLRLSTGQRKRLALLVTFLEDKQIYIFDEWAADQDPHFRDFFYEHLLKDLKSRGKTIIAVTHDDRYFHCADRVLKMDCGQFVEFDHTNREKHE